MRRSEDRILTTHTGSLPRPGRLLALNRELAARGGRTELEYDEVLHEAVADVVGRQSDLGVDVVNDGEYGKAMRQGVDFGAWKSYSFQRLAGITVETLKASDVPAQRSMPGHVVLTSAADRRDRLMFPETYADPVAAQTRAPELANTVQQSVCVGPITYTGRAAVEVDIANLRSVMNTRGIREGFISSLGVASCSRMRNEFYESDEAVLYACADAMREEYLAIVDAGLVLQIDDPAITDNWDMVNPEPTVAEYRAFTMVRVDALNYALRDIPEDRVRFHLCWGSWHGPHTTDIPMRDILPVMLAVRAGGYVFEAGNARHEHEWKVWQDVPLPEGKVIVPGVVSHATNVVEHPDLVAERIIRFATLVGRENVLAGTDCGLGGRVLPEIAWAKLGTLAEGARRASAELWP